MTEGVGIEAVRDHDLRVAYALLALRRGDEVAGLDVARACRGTNLREHRAPRVCARPAIDGRYKSVERQLRPDGDEDHRTEPA